VFEGNQEINRLDDSQHINLLNMEKQEGPLEKGKSVD
jgi:hypothetical protein